MSENEDSESIHSSSSDEIIFKKQSRAADRRSLEYRRSRSGSSVSSEPPQGKRASAAKSVPRQDNTEKSRRTYDFLESSSSGGENSESDQDSKKEDSNFEADDDHDDDEDLHYHPAKAGKRDTKPKGASVPTSSVSHQHDETENPLLAEPYQRQLLPGVGVRNMNTFVTVFARKQMEREAESLARSMGREYKRQGQFSDYQALHTQTITRDIMGKLKSKLRNTTLPGTYAPCEDHAFEDLNAANEDRRKSKQESLETIERVREEQEKLQEEYRKKFVEYERVKRRFEELQTEGRREAHPLLAGSSVNTESAGHESQSKARKFRPAPQGTMNRLMDKIIENF